MGKRYKCPYDDTRLERKELIKHVNKYHQDLLPEGYTPERIVFDTINKKNHGTCRICGEDTKWVTKTNRYNILCENPKCKEAMRKEYEKNMLRVRGTTNILNDPEQQKRMLANRRISGNYKFMDGGVLTYTGSYEKKCLEFIDKALEVESKYVLSPGPVLEYEYEGEKHLYITDLYLIPWNLIIEIKDGGDNPNNKRTAGMISSREKTIAKEKLITDKGEYNYLRLTNNNFAQLIEVLMELKDNAFFKNDNKVIRINESTNDGETIEEILDKTNYNKVWLTSDWHIFKNRYKREINYVNTKDIIKYCKDTIKDDDVFMYLGDISFRYTNDEDNATVQDIFKSLPGIKVLILGNHDKMAGSDFYSNCGFDYVFDEFQYKNMIFTHRPIDMALFPEDYVNIHGHIHNIETYNTTDGKRNVNVYPLKYNNKPTTLKYVLNNFDKLSKNNTHNDNAMLGEAFIDDSINILESFLSNSKPVDEWSMASCNPITPMSSHKPYVMVSTNNTGGLLSAKKYSLATDLISDKYLVINEESKLSIVDSSYFNNCLIEEYEFVGNKARIAKLYEAYTNSDIVDEDFIYGTLCNKPVLSNDQINFDESFIKVNFDKFKDKKETIIATFKEQMLKDTISFPVLLENTIKSNRYNKCISLREDVDGYYYYNSLNKNRTKSVSNKINLTESMIQSLF